MLNFYSYPFRALLLLFVFACHLPVVAQTPAWQSAQTVAASTAATIDDVSRVIATAVDAAGNVYMVGEFQRTVVLGTTTLTSLGREDVFVAKFSPASNQFVWAQRAGGTGTDLATALAVSGTSVYIAGGFRSATAGFGTTTLTNVNETDVFVAKLTDAGSTGSFVWAQQAGGIGVEAASALAVNGSSVYVAGIFESRTLPFGAITLTNATPNPAYYPGYADVFVAKLTDAGPTGSFTWAQRAGGQRTDFARALAVSGSSVYVAGYLESPTTDFGPFTLTNAGGDPDVFVAKLTDAGPTASFAWAQRAGGQNTDIAEALAVNGSSVYVAGYFNSPTLAFGTTTLSTPGIFVAKLTDAGPTANFVWAQQAGGPDHTAANALAVSGTSVYVAGQYSGATVSFGTTTLTNINAGPSGNADVFVAKLMDAGPTGSFAWAQQANGMRHEVATALAVSGPRVHVGGYFNSATISFGPNTLVNPRPSPTLGFLASLTDPTLLATTPAAGAREPADFFPNPAHHTATLRLPSAVGHGPLTLTDALSRVVRRFPASVGHVSVLELKGLPPGIYLLHGAGPAKRLVVE